MFVNEAHSPNQSLLYFSFNEMHVKPACFVCKPLLILINSLEGRRIYLVILSAFFSLSCKEKKKSDFSTTIDDLSTYQFISYDLIKKNCV